MKPCFINQLKAMADETRLKILALLQGRGELCVCEIVEVVGLAQPTVSIHLSKLKRAGLVRDRRGGRWSYYSIEPKAFAGIGERVRELSGEASGSESGDHKKQVAQRYGALARRGAPSDGSLSSGCCSPSAAVNPGGCCGGGGECGLVLQPGYTVEQLEALPDGAVRASLGCGNPAYVADIEPGEVVLDLGSGGGIDAFAAARRVGPAGKVYGLDMTDEMLALARENQRQAGVDNVEFLKGDIEAIPLAAETVDLVISNCVINLATNKDRVFAEAFRILRPGGRLALADTVFQGDVTRIPDSLRRSTAAWTSCIAGALEAEDYLRRLQATGFAEVTLEVTQVYDLDLPEGTRLVSGFIRGRKPV